MLISDFTIMCTKHKSNRNDVLYLVSQCAYQFNCQPMLILKTHYGFHELFFTYLLGVTPNLYFVTIVTCKWCCLLSMPFFLLLYTWLYVFRKATYLLGVAPKHNCSQCSCTCKKHLRRSSPPDQPIKTQHSYIRSNIFIVNISSSLITTPPH
jgi:hypothetical protein